MAPSTTRKQQQVAARDGEILAVGTRILLERGYHGLTMDRIASAIGVAKGTVYQHYSSKEDLMAGIAAAVGQRRLDLFHRASVFQGRPRERMCAIGIACEIFPLLWPEEATVQLHLLSATVLEKAEPARQAALDTVETGCWECVCGIVRDAVASGDLGLDGIAEQGDRTPEQLTMGLWSTVIGAETLNTPRMRRKMSLEDPGRVSRWNCHRMMDGYGWQPLWGSWDYQDSYRRIAAEVFEPEFRDPRVIAGGVGEEMR